MVSFAFADIPMLAHEVKYDGTVNNNILSLITPPLKAPIKFDKNSSPVDFYYDLQSSSHACDYVIFYDDTLEGYPTKGNIDVDHSTNGSSWTQADSSSHSSNLYGRDGNIYYKSFTEVSAKQYWRVEPNFSGSYDASSDAAMVHKVFLGTKFTFNNSLNIRSKDYIKRNINFKTSSGIEHPIGTNYDGLELNLEVICSNTEKQNFQAKLNAPEKYYCFLIDTDNLILDGISIAYFEIEDVVSRHHKSGHNFLNISLRETV